MRFDPSLYLVLDLPLKTGRQIAECVLQAVRGGVTAVQLRYKTGSPDDIERTAKELVALLQPFGIPVILNDHPELVGKVGAQGAHIGRSDMSPRQARQLLPPNAILGIS